MGTERQKRLISRQTWIKKKKTHPIEKNTFKASDQMSKIITKCDNFVTI